MSGLRARQGRTILALILFVAAMTGCAPRVSFPQLQFGPVALGPGHGIALGAVDFEVSLDLVDLRELAAARKNKASTDGLPSDTELYAPWIEREVDRQIKASPISRITSTPTYTLVISAAFFSRDTKELKKEEVKLEKRVVDVRESYDVTRVNDLILNYRIVSRKTGTTAVEGKQEGVRSQFGKGKTAAYAVETFEPWETVMEALVVQQTGKMMATILPRTVMVERPLREGSTGELRDAAATAVREGLDRARPLWLAIRDSGEALPEKDRAGLLYDLGISYESQDELEEARKSFAGCLAIWHDAWCARALERIAERTRIFER